MGAQWLESLRTFDLQELNLKHAGMWSARRKAVVAAGLVALLLLTGYGLWLKSGLARFHEQRNAEPELTAQLATRAREAASLVDHRRHLEALQAAFDDVMRQLPRQSQVPGLLDEVSRLAQNSGLIIEQIQWLPETLQPVYSELPLQLMVVGGYHDLGVFLSGIADLPRIVTVHDFTLTAATPAANGPLRMTLLAKTYRANDQGLIP
ncbi:pilus assembly protein PilO [Pseudomonas lundensis]|uniref:Pilus assembly protein PilO n=1 Tax=Pseudomonas lundensis TaxID=86185 RepID=A0A266N9H3_9PSED|nr:type 4a pilus biogenesis protein PilO [Pseudomonas lundensis]OZY59168.1 pilus assembly protein PilO [Pseudomonas lundensis]